MKRKINLAFVTVILCLAVWAWAIPSPQLPCQCEDVCKKCAKGCAVDCEAATDCNCYEL